MFLFSSEFFGKLFGFCKIQPRLGALLGAAIGYALVMYRFSVWRTAKMLDQKSRPLTDPAILRLADRMAHALDLPEIKVHVFEVEPVNGLAAPDGRIDFGSGPFAGDRGEAALRHRNISFALRLRHLAAAGLAELETARTAAFNAAVRAAWRAYRRALPIVHW